MSPNSDTRAGELEVDGPARSRRAQASPSAPEGWGWRRGRRSRRHSSRLPLGIGGNVGDGVPAGVVEPGTRPSRAGRWRSGRTGRPGGGRWRSGGPGAARRRRRLVTRRPCGRRQAEVAGRPTPSNARRPGRRSAPAAGHTSRSGRHGSWCGRRRGPGQHVAHQPARERELDVGADPVGAALRGPAHGAAIRWVSHRSTPRVGTATTSAAKGSPAVPGQHLHERVDQGVGPFAAMDSEHDDPWGTRST